MSELDSVTNSMIKYYAEQAPEYDHWLGYDCAEIQEKLTPIKQHLHATFADRKVLEIACGPGHWTSVLAQTARSILGIDINEPMLAEAHKKQFPSGKVRLQHGDAYALAEVDGGFDGAFAYDWFSHIPNSRMQGFLENLHRKLTPEAVVVFIDGIDPGPAPTRRDHEGNLIQTRLLSNGAQYEVIKNCPSEAELRSCIGEMGRNVDYRVVWRRWILTYRLAT